MLFVHTRRAITKKILLHPYFFYKNIFVALSLIGVVFIRGLSEDTTEDGLCNYLENTMRLGDRPVEELKITGNSARVKFESANGIK